MSTVQTRLVTYAEYKNFESDDNFQYELLNGELVRKSAPSPQHQMVLRNINRQVDAYVSEKKLGEVLFAPIDVFLDEHNAPQPDMVFVSNAKLSLITDDGIMGAPDLVVEIVSPTSIIRDRVDKMRLYTKYQIPEYWIIDPNNRSVEIYAYTPEEGYVSHSFATSAGAVTSNILAGFELNLENVFKGKD